ncbi:MAG: hypothetical protein KFF77_03840 [Bacteroidetes bacterium]|nr:hypothetical protein [Bacteroidota bacterium]
MSAIAGNQRQQVPGADPRPRHGVLIRRLLVTSLVVTLPATAFLLWILTGIEMWPENIDINGLLATAVGILGVFVFFLLLYRLQTGAQCSIRGRLALLGLHAGITVVLFLFTIWLGYDSPWRSRLLWGSYDMLSAAKSWIISVLVIGSITLMGVIMDMVRRHFERRYGRDDDLPHRSSAKQRGGG